MRKVKSSIILGAFNQVFSIIGNIYPIKCSENSFKICTFSLNLTRFETGFRGPTIWNRFLRNLKNLKLALLYLKTRF